MKKPLLLLMLIFAALIFYACSSAPVNPGDITDLRRLSERELAIAKQAAGRGDFITAEALLNEARRRAVMVDDWSLIIRSGLSLGNVLFATGRTDEAFAEWEQAVYLGEIFGNRELLAIARVYMARGQLLSGSIPPQEVLDIVIREAANIRGDNLHLAFSWQVRALALRELQSFSQAEAAARRSLEIHQKERYLENASFDWFLIASIRSLSGNFSDAVLALQESITFDRRVENSWGLAASWRAIGDVQQRAGNLAEAKSAYRRARAIFAAMGNEQAAAEIDIVLEALAGLVSPTIN